MNRPLLIRLRGMPMDERYHDGFLDLTELDDGPRDRWCGGVIVDSGRRDEFGCVSSVLVNRGVHPPAG
jgi:hypothetical protein